MSGEATVSGSAAALKYLYPKGEPPKEVNDMTQLLKKLKKEQNFVGDSAFVPIQNANPQGCSSTVSAAQTALFQGNYVRFQLTRKSHYSLARITGEAAEAAVKDEGALVDLWKNETEGAAVTEAQVTAAYVYGSGDAILGRLDGSATVTATTVTLASGTNMNYFELNMLLQAVDTTGLSPTTRSGSVRITGIDRRNRKLTAAANFDDSGNIPNITNTDYFVRYGDGAASGTGKVLTGLDEYVKGGTTPGTLFGLNRNTDPVRLAGQAIDYSGWAMEDAVVDASAQSGFQGLGYPDVVVMNNIEFANMKKSLGSKIQYFRGTSGSTDKGTHSFSELMIEGEDGPITIVADPFCPRNKAWLLKLDAISLFSIKAWPHLCKFDGLDFLRLSSDDSFEVRWLCYGNLKVKSPGPHVKLTNFGL